MIYAQRFAENTMTDFDNQRKAFDGETLPKGIELITYTLSLDEVGGKNIIGIEG